ncbi:MAG: glucose-1-phosphate adenylyltransferase [Spirochaetaceae bacterium]|nr:glucose-1-phosphate adenylyltransferase [Spirochaetaceae bacterium]
MAKNVLTIVLGGGKGTRLYPLTKDRAKPAVPFGAKYRIVDIPLSNSINAGFKRIYILTQYNSASLHMHIAKLYSFDAFTKGFVEILAAEQTFDSQSWYEGTADAVRKNFIHFRQQNPDYYMILSGDQLYRMNLADFLKNHISKGAEISIAATPVDRTAASGFGILQADKTGRIASFVEKPAPDANIDHLKIAPDLHPDKQQLKAGKEYTASMGIYIFNAAVLEKMLDNTMTDFGKEIIPMAIEKHKVQVYVFSGFWEDIGTIKSFYETNLNLARINPDFNFYDEDHPIFTTDYNLPPSKFNFSTLSEVLTGDGCIVTKSMLTRSVISIRSIIETGANLEGTITMGADFYETPADRIENRKKGRPDIGIGRNSQIRGAIIDKNARIGDGCLIGVHDAPRNDGDYEGYYIRDGIIIIPKSGIIPSGTVI